MKYTVKPTSKFQKDLKRIQKRGYDMRLIANFPFFSYSHPVIS